MSTEYLRIIEIAGKEGYVRNPCILLYFVVVGSGAGGEAGGIV